ncbi:50S ribosomal protein L13 [Patescibacteria group bacterium]|nr:50S ribosomal protein L13 [Patescibacteria group bacterium]
MKKATRPTKISDVKRSWHLLDAKGKILGRIASEAALKLMGKSKPYFVRHLDCGDYVVVINGAEVAVTGKKEEQKLYGTYSGYPGGLKQKALRQVRKEKPTKLIRNAVFGMLPKNKLRDRLITRLYVFAGNEHTYGDKFVTEKTS